MKELITRHHKFTTSYHKLRGACMIITKSGSQVHPPTMVCLGQLVWPEHTMYQWICLVTYFQPLFRNRAREKSQNLTLGWDLEGWLAEGNPLPLVIVSSRLWHHPWSSPSSPSSNPIVIPNLIWILMCTYLIPHTPFILLRWCCLPLWRNPSITMNWNKDYIVFICIMYVVVLLNYIV
jgi:hypothetical protein